jgi:hypothetical protein
MSKQNCKYFPPDSSVTVLHASKTYKLTVTIFILLHYEFSFMTLLISEQDLHILKLNQVFQTLLQAGQIHKCLSLATNAYVYWKPSATIIYTLMSNLFILPLQFDTWISTLHFYEEYQYRLLLIRTHKLPCRTPHSEPCPQHITYYRRCTRGCIM